MQLSFGLFGFNQISRYFFGVGHQLIQIWPGDYILVVVIPKSMATGFQSEGFGITGFGQRLQGGSINIGPDSPDARRRERRAGRFCPKEFFMGHIIAVTRTGELVLHILPRFVELTFDPGHHLGAFEFSRLGFLFRRHLVQHQGVEDFDPGIGI